MNERRTIQRVGFRKWYERELLHSHGYLVIALLCFVGLLGGIELFSEGGGLDRQLIALACAGVSAAFGYRALWRYLYLLGHAQRVAEQAICPACRAYARWDIEDDEQERAQDVRLRVRCRGCANVWYIVV